MAELTEKEKELVRGVWTHIEKDYSSVGQVLFREYFAAYPDYIKYFEDMKTNPYDDLFESPLFKDHIEHAMFPAIAQMLENLDQPYELLKQLQEFALSHKQKHLMGEHFESMHKTFMVVFKKVLGDQFTPEAEAAWDKILTIACEVIIDEFLDY